MFLSHVNKNMYNSNGFFIICKFLFRAVYLKFDIFMDTVKYTYHLHYFTMQRCKMALDGFGNGQLWCILVTDQKKFSNVKILINIFQINNRIENRKSRRMDSNSFVIYTGVEYSRKKINKTKEARKKQYSFRT